jgi:hypothetical protein
MADAVTSQIIVDGKYNAIIKFTNISDGTGESAVTKVTPSSLTFAPTRVGIQRIRASTFGMGVNILWDATADVLAFHVPQDNFVDFDFTDFSNVPNNAGAGITGIIQFTTVGHSVGDVYTIILNLVKQY